MALRAWRRTHGEHIVAFVVAAGDFWRPSVRLIIDPAGTVHESHLLPFLQSAQAAADDLACELFEHRCAAQTCGEWMAWPVDGR